MRMVRISALLSLAAALAAAETFTGTLVDVMCKDKDLATHTRDCALQCARSGFGLALSDGKFVKFDESGNAKAVAALKASKKQSDLKAKVTGTMEGDVLKVESLQLD